MCAHMCPYVVLHIWVYAWYMYFCTHESFAWLCTHVHVPGVVQKEQEVRLEMLCASEVLKGVPLMACPGTRLHSQLQA